MLLVAAAMLVAATGVATADSRFYVSPSTGLVLADSARGSGDGLAIGFAGGRWFGPRWAAEVGLHSISFDSEADSDVAWSEIGLRLDGQYRLLPGYRVRPYLGLGLGLLQADRSDIDFDTGAFSLEPGVGLLARLNEQGMRLRVDLRYRLEQLDLPDTGGETLGETQLSIGLVFPFGPKPEAVAVASPAPRAPLRRAPAPTAPLRSVPARRTPLPSAQPSALPTVRSRSGRRSGQRSRARSLPLPTAAPQPILQSQPSVAIAPSPSPSPVITPRPTAQPTPEPTATPLPAVDDCSRTIAGRTLEARGCVVDGDSDGVPDADDLCAGTPDYLTVDEKGCPADSDADGVPDFADSCEGTVKGALVTGSGCALPDTRVVGVINFATGDSALTKSGKGAVDAMFSEVMGQLGQYPVMRVEVAGHSEDNAQAGETVALSRYRAKLVKDYLVKSGVPAERISAKGYGGSEPVSDNVTIRGRLRNRRVEVRLVRKLVN